MLYLPSVRVNLVRADPSSARCAVLNTFLHLVEIGLVAAGPSVRPSKLPNTSVTTVLVDETGLGEILAWGDVSHLLIPSDGTATPNGGQKPTMVGNMEGGE